MPSKSKMEDAIDCSLFLREHNNPMPAKVVNAIASRAQQWKHVKFEKTPAGCPIPKEGEIWDPVIGAGPFRPYMVPKGVPVADGVLVMMRLYYQLPPSISGITLAELQEIDGFSQTGKIEPEVVDTRRYNGSTVYDVDGKIMTIDEVVMRGNSALDARRRPGFTNETNFLKPGGLEKQLWFNRLFNGADTPTPGLGAAFAQQRLTDYGYYIHEDNQHPNLNGPRVDPSKQERSKLYYSILLSRCNGPLETTSPIEPKSAPSLKLRLNLKTAQKAQDVLVENNEDKDCAESELSELSESSEESEESEFSEEMAIIVKRRKLIPRSEIATKLNNSVVASFGNPSGDKNNEESNEKAVSAPTNSLPEPEVKKALNTLEPPLPAQTNNITSAPIETSAERAAKVKKELAVRTKEVEEMTRELKEFEEKAAAEKAAVEKAAAKKAAAEKAAVEKEAAEKAAAKLAKKNERKSMKYIVQSAKYSLSAYRAQRMADTADKALVAKLDEELAPYLRDALNDTASESQKRKFKEEDNDNTRPAKVAKK